MTIVRSLRLLAVSVTLTAESVQLGPGGAQAKIK